MNVHSYLGEEVRALFFFSKCLILCDPTIRHQKVQDRRAGFLTSPGLLALKVVYSSYLSTDSCVEEFKGSWGMQLLQHVEMKEDEQKT